MNRLDNMLERLPPPWRIEAGSLLWRLLQIVGNQLDAFDEDLDRVQRSHWIETAFDRVDLWVGNGAQLSPTVARLVKQAKAKLAAPAAA